MSVSYTNFGIKKSLIQLNEGLQQGIQLLSDKPSINQAAIQEIENMRGKIVSFHNERKQFKNNWALKERKDQYSAAFQAFRNCFQPLDVEEGILHKEETYNFVARTEEYKNLIDAQRKIANTLIHGLEEELNVYNSSHAENNRGVISKLQEQGNSDATKTSLQRGINKLNEEKKSHRSDIAWSVVYGVVGLGGLTAGITMAILFGFSSLILTLLVIGAIAIAMCISQSIGTAKIFENLNQKIQRKQSMIDENLNPAFVRRAEYALNVLKEFVNESALRDRNTSVRNKLEASGFDVPAEVTDEQVNNLVQVLRSWNEGFRSQVYSKPVLVRDLVEQINRIFLPQNPE